MNRTPRNAERISETVARRLLERATSLEDESLTLIELRQAATEAGISSAAFDAAVAEWRAASANAPAPSTRPKWSETALRNAGALAAGWSAVGWTALILLAAPQRLTPAPWLIHTLTDAVGLGFGAIIAARLRARPAMILLGGLAVAQSAELLMNVFSGMPAISGFGAHMALMIAGVAGVAVGQIKFGNRRKPPVGTTNEPEGAEYRGEGDASTGSERGDERRSHSFEAGRAAAGPVALSAPSLTV